jgi:hypothetical protein
MRRMQAILNLGMGWALLGWLSWWGADAASAQMPKAVPVLAHEELLRLLAANDPRSAREAAEAIQNESPKNREELLATAEAVKSALSTTRDATAEAALRLALGKLGAAGVEDAAEWGFESMSVTHNAKTPKEVFDAHVRALEMVPGAAKELMLGNLDVALNFPEAEPKERQRLKEFVTLTAEGMRTRELSIFLDALLLGEEDLFVKLEAPLEVRLMACYKHVTADPPINAEAVLTWLEKHPGGPVEVEIAALEVASLVGTTKTDALSKLAERLLAKPQTAMVLARHVLSGNLDRKLLPRVKEAIAQHVQKEPTEELRRLLQDLK